MAGLDSDSSKRTGIIDLLFPKHQPKDYSDWYCHYGHMDGDGTLSFECGERQEEGD